MKSFIRQHGVLLTILAFSALLATCEQPVVTDTSSADVALAKASVAPGYSLGDKATAVTADLSLPTSGPNGVRIAWSSNHPAVSVAGAVTRPAAGEPDAEVTLTATLTKNSARDSKIFPLTVIAEPPTLSVVYWANGGTGTVIDSALYGVGQQVTPMPNGFSRTGYTFLEWNTAPDGSNGTAYPAGVPFTISTSLTLYARWTINLYSLDFDSQGGSPVSSVTVPYGKINNLPAPPTLLGSTFSGWWTLPAGNGSPFLTTTAVTADLTVYAKWLPVSYAVTFDSQGGTSVPPANANHGTTISPPLPTRTGYTFAGWWTATGGNGSQVTSSTKIVANLLVFAYWVKNEYTVTFDSQGGTTVASVTASFNSTINLPTPTRTGYTFGGWRTGPNGGGEAVLGWTPITYNTTLYAQWSLNYYTVTFDGQGTNNYIDSVAHGSTPNILPQPARYGYTFEGWRTGTNGGGLPFTRSTVITASITVYAQWTPLTYAVTFDSQGGTAVTGMMVTHGSTVTLPAPPTRTGYTFAGWRTEMYGAGVAVTSSTTVTFDRTFYASWTANIYTLTFDSQGGTPVPSQNAAFGSSVTLPSPPTRTGYFFWGWRTGPNGSGSRFSSGSAMPTDITIYAEWLVNTYTIRFDLNGASGSVPVPQTAPYNTTISLPTPSGSWRKSEYVFDGWSTGSGGTGTRFSADTPVTGDATLYARWIQLAQWIQSSTAPSSGSYLDVASDQTGNTYAAGYLDGVSSVSFGGAFVTPHSGVHSVLIVKYNSSGVAQWARSVVSSTGNTIFRGVDVDGDGNSYAVGYSQGTGEADLGNGVSVTGAAAILVKYSNAGVPQWVRSVSGGVPDGSGETFDGVCVDGAGNLYAVGSLTGTGTADFGNGVTTARPCDFLVKYNSSGTALWVQTPGITVTGVATDGSNVAVAGRLWGTGSVGFGNNVSASGATSTNNAVVVKYDAQGKAQWAQAPTQQSPSTLFNEVVGDGVGNFYLAGYIDGTTTAGFGNGVTSTGTFAGANLVVVKYNSSGSAQWATQLISSSTNSAGTGIAVSGGNLFVVGVTHGNYSTVDFGKGVEIWASAGVDPFLVKYDTAGVPQWAQSLLSGTNTANNSANAVVADAFGDPYMVGRIMGLGSYSFGNDVTTADGPYVLKYYGH